MESSLALWNFSEQIMIIHLLHGALGLKEDPSTKKFTEDAAYAPHVHRGGVVSRTHQDFRCAIILRHYFLGHVHVLIGLGYSGQSEITDLRKGID